MAIKEEGAVVPASSVVEDEEDYEEEEYEEEEEEVVEEEYEEVEEEDEGEEVEEEEEEEGEEEEPEEEEELLPNNGGKGERIGSGIGIEAPHSLKKSMDELRSFHSSLTSFFHKFNDLERYLLSIDAAIDALKNSSSSYSLDSLSNAISSRTLRRYIQTHMDELSTLRQDVPLALKRAEDPPKLVLESIGRFYLQGSRAYEKGSHQIASRNASLLILEFFLLAQCLDIQPSVKQEADAAALAWRKRIFAEGGFAAAHTQDARGLLLFMASYGIPSVFKNDELSYLFWLSNPIEIAPALRLSPFLKQRMPVMIDGMIQQGMCVAAVYAAHVFGIADKYVPESIIESFLRESNETWKNASNTPQSSPGALKEANKKQLAALKSVTKCLNDCNVDARKFSEFDIEGEIGKLEKDIPDDKEKAMRNEEVKRYRAYPKQRGRFSGGGRLLHGAGGVPTSFMLQPMERGAYGGGQAASMSMEPYYGGPAPASSDLYQFADSF